MELAAETSGWVGIVGTAITTVGTVAVAFITARGRSAQKKIQKQNKETADKNADAILAAISALRAEVGNNSRVTVANARAIISQIYTENKDHKAISEKTWRNVMELHEAYKSVKVDGHTPNSWCDQIVEEMTHWEKV